LRTGDWKVALTGRLESLPYAGGNRANFGVRVKLTESGSQSRAKDAGREGASSHAQGGRAPRTQTFGLSVLLVPAQQKKKAGASNAPASVITSPPTDYGEEMM
jgi:hypothetical protein